MIASDIPAGHATPYDMARSLATYINCPDRIYRSVKEAFGSSPCRSTIRDLRRLHLAPDRKCTQAAKPHEGYWPGEASEKLSEANRKFLQALEAERQRA